MGKIQSLFDHSLKHLLPGLLVVTIVGVTVFTAMGEAYDGNTSGVVVAESDPVSIDGRKKKESEKKSPAIIGDIDLSKCADGTYTGRGQGYAGYLEVDVTVKKHEITKIILTANEADDIPYLNKAKTIMPMVVEKQSLDVDTVSGATYSCNGILSAIEDALKQAMGEESSYVDEDKKTSTDSSDNTSFIDGEYNDGTYNGSAKAYRGNIEVAVKIKDGKIKTIKIQKTRDDADYLAMCKNVIPSIIKKQSPNVDTVSGATYSSKGIINATKNALKKALKNTTTGNKDLVEDKNDNPPTTGPTIPDEEDDNDDIIPSGMKYDNGTYNGSALGYHPWYEIKVQVLVESNSISTVDITDHAEDDEYMDPVIKYLIPRIIKRQGTDGIDTVSGATWSSQGILDAVDEALKDAVLSE